MRTIIVRHAGRVSFSGDKTTQLSRGERDLVWQVCESGLMIFISVVVGPVGARSVCWVGGGGGHVRVRMSWNRSSFSEYDDELLPLRGWSPTKFVLKQFQPLCKPLWWYVFQIIISPTFGCFNLVISLRLRKHCSRLQGSLEKEVKRENLFQTHCFQLQWRC